MITPKRHEEIIDEALFDLLEYYNEAVRMEAEMGGDSTEEIAAFEELCQKCRDVKQVIEMR